MYNVARVQETLCVYVRACVHACVRVCDHYQSKTDFTGLMAYACISAKR